MDLRQLQDDAEETFWEKRDLFAVVVAAVVVGFLVFEEFIRSVTGIEITTTENVLFILAYLFVFVQVLADRTEEIRVTNERELSEIRSLVEDNVRFIGGPDSRNSDDPQDRANDDLRAYIRSNDPDEMNMIEYSSSTVTPLLQAANKTDCEIRLLVKKPASAEPARQPNRIVQGIDRLYVGNLDEENLRIRLYEENASLRGRKIDDELINVGWYTYDRREQNRDLQIWGSQNAMVTVQKDSFEEFAALDELFSEVFENLWREATSLAAVHENGTDEHVLEWLEVGSRESKEAWIEAVSQ